MWFIGVEVESKRRVHLLLKKIPGSAPDKSTSCRAERPTASDEVAKDFFESLEAAVSFRLKSEIYILHWLYFRSKYCLQRGTPNSKGRD